MDKKEYYLGLDMGTSSVGWAITDLEYKLLRKKGKDLWGIREFDEAKTAADRRAHRVSRRRRQREQVRMNLLRSYFAESIEAVDPVFFHRLDNSKYYLQDKDSDVQSPNGVFNDINYTDKEYYEQFPTIFHLRKELIENKHAPYDVRFVYLAISNMFKHRGHFLNAGLNDDEGSTQISEAYKSFIFIAEETLGALFPEGAAERINSILSDRSVSKTRKCEMLEEVFEVEKADKIKQECCKAISGRSTDVKKLFPSIELDEKVTFSFADYEEDKEEKVIKALGDERYQLISAMKELFDASILSGILGSHDYLSFARVEAYEKHKKDLIILKRLIRKQGNPEQYDAMFRGEDSGSYSAYVNSYNTNNNVQRRDFKARKKDDFYDFVKKQIRNYPDSDDKTYVLKEMESETFMPKQLTAANGVIPNQIHAKELKAILRNASQYLSFLNDVDDSGLTTSDRILRLFSFQIPYYVGPVSENSKNNNGNGWVVRKAAGPVLPWNIEEKIDMNETRNNFISNLIRECTYINGEKVLPKASLLYERYCVLNEINNIRIGGERLTPELKQDIYNSLFIAGKKVTRNELFEYLRTRGLIVEKEQLSGIDVNINNRLTSYGKLRAILGDEINSDAGRTMAEEIIYLCTIYGDSRKFVKDQLRNKYPSLTEKQIGRITGLKFKDWGRLSKEFLMLPGVEKGTGEIRPLITAMWETNYNLMELLNSDLFTYKDALEEKQEKKYLTLSDITPEALEDYCFSAPVRKMINQTIKIIRETEASMGCPPKKVFIEMTRTDEEKGNAGRTDSRKKQLLELYKSIKDESVDWKDLIEKEDQSGRLRSKKMYLYITQMGRDMYTGKSIDLDDLFYDNLYDIDHIYPRHFVKDDSIHNNLVLVNKTSNAHKSDIYPLESLIRNNPEITGHWAYLLSKGLITEEKYRRLTGRKEFTDDQKADFIARQLVETGQGTKGVADLLKQVLPETEIVYSKASNVTDFRKKFGLPKSRTVNDFHHANDAYLNIVVGNVYNTKFTRDPKNYILKEYNKNGENREYNLNKMFDHDVKRNGEIAWIASSGDGDEGTIATVRKVISRNTPLMTRQSFTGHGGLADQTLYSKRKASGIGYIPLKTSKDPKMSGPQKYGGFGKAATAYFCLVEYKNKSKIVRSIEAVPIYIAERIKKDHEQLNIYIKEQLGVADCSVRLDRIPMQSLIRWNGFEMHLSGKTGDRLALRNAVNICLAPKWIGYINKLEKYRDKGRVLPEINADENIALYRELIQKHTEGIYARRPNPIGQKLINGEKLFIGLPIEKQCAVLLQIFRVSAIGADSQADLRAIDGSEHTGAMKVSKKIPDNIEFLLINKNVLGTTEQKIDLRTI